MFLDPATRTYVEETGGANFLFVKKDGTLVTPKSDSILPSITRRSLITIATDMLGMKVEHRPVKFSEVSEFAEAGLCGTAAVICPVGKVVDHGKEVCLPSGMDEMGPVLTNSTRPCVASRWAKSKAPKAGSTKLNNLYFVGARTWRTAGICKMPVNRLARTGAPRGAPTEKRLVAHATSLFYNTPKPSSNIFRPIRMRTMPPIHSALFYSASRRDCRL